MMQDDDYIAWRNTLQKLVDETVSNLLVAAFAGKKIKLLILKQHTHKKQQWQYSGKIKECDDFSENELEDYG